MGSARRAPCFAPTVQEGKGGSNVMAQLELETRYAQLVCAEIAVFVYGDRVDEALARLGAMAEEDRLADVVGGAGLRVADVRAESREVHAHGGLMWVDITVPSHFGCHAFELGADVQCEALDRVAGGLLDHKVVALSARGARAVARVGDLPSCALAQDDLEVIAHGLDSVSTRMQRHFDHARALAEYLSCCDGLVRVDYPGLARIPIARWPSACCVTASVPPSISSSPGIGAPPRGISSSAAVSMAEIVTPADPVRVCMRAMGGRGARFAYSPASTTPSP